MTVIGAIAGLTIFLGLPIARLRGVDRRVPGFLNAIATGVVLFLLVEILSRAAAPLEAAVVAAHHGSTGPVAAFGLLYAGGVAAGLLGLTWFDRSLARRLGREPLQGPGAAVASASRAVPSARVLALMIAAGLGLHNFSEGLAIGQSAAAGALALTGVLVIGFGLHNITEGFGIAAPLTAEAAPPGWGFLALAGLMAGAPTMIGSMIGFHVVSPYAFVVFLSLAGGALIYVLNQMFAVSRRLNGSVALATGLLTGLLAGLGTDLLLTYLGA